MKKITEKEFKQSMDIFLEEATEEPIQIEVDNNTLFISTIDNLHIIDNEWLKDFMAIPQEFRVNPFDISDSGDLYWADKRNVEAVKAITEVL